MTDFFISYTQVDRPWAEWIAWQLEAAGYTTTVQAWDFRPGTNFVLAMQQAAAEAERTMLVLSPSYFVARFTQPEWAAAFARDPTGEQGLVLPVRVRACNPRGLLPQLVYIDLVDLSEAEAREALLVGVQWGRAKPLAPPPFPETGSRADAARPRFPGTLPLPPARPAWDPERATDLDSRNRRAMLEKVWAMWIAGVLRRSLHTEVLLAVGLAEHPPAVTRPLDPLVHRPEGDDRPLPPGTRVVDVFDEHSGALLILGAPGAGKTTLLLELAAALLNRAARDRAHPIPVVFPLSTWAETRRPLAEWLVDQLEKLYDVPRKLTRTWVEAEQILPLLDGLDEVKPDHRADCVAAINAFRHTHGLLPLAVCSRAADYDALSRRLRLQGAIVVQPLARAQVEAYLAQIGAPVAAVRQALHEDPTLWELVETPLMLSIVVLTYAGRAVSELQAERTPEGRRRRLFATYLEQMFHHRGVIPSYAPERTRRWLAWLAWHMVQHSQTVFYIERLQPYWLPPRQRWIMTGELGLLLGLVGGLVGGLLYWWVGGLAGWPPLGLAGWSLSGLVGGLVGGLLYWWVGVTSEIKSVEIVRWSWPAAPSWILIRGLFFGLVFGLLSMPLSGWLDGSLFWLLYVLLSMLLSGLLFLLYHVLSEGLSGSEREAKTVPNQGIRRSARNAVVYGLLSGLVGGLFSPVSLELLSTLHVGLRYGLGDELFVQVNRVVDGLSVWLLHGLPFALVGGLKLGGEACLQHLLLRLALVYNDAAPWRYAPFLDYAAERILLRKVGGGYIFIHRSLLEYFASLHPYEPSLPAARPAGEGSQGFLRQTWPVASMGVLRAMIKKVTMPKALLTGVVVLIAVGMAVYARHQLAMAHARHLAAVAEQLLAKQPDLALLLSLEAHHKQQTAETRDMLLRGLHFSPALISFLHGHTGSVQSVAFSPDGTTLASSGWNEVRLWDVARRQPLGAPLSGHTGWVWSVAFSPDGTTLASGGGDETVRLWDVARRQPLGAPLSGHTSDVWSVAFSPDGTTLASGSDDGTVRLWDVARRQLLGAPLSGSPDPVRSVAFSPDGTTLASGGFLDAVRLWDVARRQLLGAPLTSHIITSSSMAFSPDGTILAACGGGAVRLWDVARRQLLGTPLPGHTGYVQSVAFSPDGTTLAVGDDDGMVRLWDVARRQPLGTPLPGHTGGVQSVAFSPDGTTLAAGNRDDNMVRLWDVARRQPGGAPLPGSPAPVMNSESWQERACRIANRNLTCSEWKQYVGLGGTYRATCPQFKLPVPQCL